MSNPTPKWYGTCHNGMVQLDRREVYVNYLRSLEDKKIELIIRPRRDDKSTRQLRYLHGVICKYMADHTGYTRKEVKGLLKAHFLSETVTSRLNGKEMTIVPSLADLKKAEMSEFIENCIMLAAEMGVVIPSPDQVDY